MSELQILAAVSFCAVFIEWLAGRFLGKLVAGEYMIWATAILGVALCLVYRLDVLRLLGMPIAVGDPYTGQVITGIIVGAGSNAVHRFLPTKTSEPSEPS